MKIFIDTANIDEITKANELGILDGVTTNPTLIAKEGMELKYAIEKICSIVNGPVSAEVISLNTSGMVKEARELASIAENVVVKIPLIKEGLKAVKIVSAEGINVNVTLCFQPVQALLAAKAGATYVSTFVGRLDDISTKGMEVVRDIKNIYSNYNFTTEIIVASIRHPVHVLEAARCGADVATIPYAVFDKLVNHPLTEIGIRKFLTDWEKGLKI